MTPEQRAFKALRRGTGGQPIPQDDNLIDSFAFEIRQARREALEDGVAECARKVSFKASDAPEGIDRASWNLAVVACRDAIRALMEKEE